MGNSAIHFHLYSGNAQDVTERLDKGLLDFGVLIQPADLSRYQSLQLKGKDQWGVLMPKDSPLAAKKAIYKKDLLDLPLICSRQAIARHISGNAFSDWFGEDFERLNIVGTFNLIYNAALLVEAGAGYAISLDGLTDTSRDSALCFRPLSPRLESRLAIVWKKDQVVPPAAAAPNPASSSLINGLAFADPDRLLSGAVAGNEAFESEIFNAELDSVIAPRLSGDEYIIVRPLAADSSSELSSSYMTSLYPTIFVPSISQMDLQSSVLSSNGFEDNFFEVYLSRISG